MGLKCASYAIERQIMVGMWETMAPTEWSLWRNATVCRIPRDGVTVPRGRITPMRRY